MTDVEFSVAANSAAGRRTLRDVARTIQADDDTPARRTIAGIAA